MQKTPKNLLARFHAMFTTHILLGIIGLARHHRIACHGYVEALYLDAQEKTPGLVDRGFLVWLPAVGGEVAGAVSPMRSLATRSLNAIQ